MMMMSASLPKYLITARYIPKRTNIGIATTGAAKNNQEWVTNGLRGAAIPSRTKKANHKANVTRTISART
ncbi:hypothetical protein D3C78_1441040 [compost metagenome]